MILDKNNGHIPMNNNLVYLDTETCGLHGPIVLLQYAYNDGEIILHAPWSAPIVDTLILIEEICKETVVGFNLAFDWFHICQMYTTLLLLAAEVGFDAFLEDHIEDYARLEPLGRDGPCLKPKSAFDIMLHARKGPYQSTMDRKDVKIKRIPTELAQPLITELDKRIKIKDIYFARRKDKKAPKWSIQPISGEPNFVNLILKFKPSSALKALAVDALELTDVRLFKDIELDHKWRPIEFGWAPFALAVSTPERSWNVTVRKGKDKRSGYAWPGLIRRHITHWGYNEMARDYAKSDVDLTRRMYHFFDDPAPGDNDSILACLVGAVRWRGFAIDVNGITKLRQMAIEKGNAAPKAPKAVYKFIEPYLSATEKCVIEKSTKRVILEEISRWVDHPAAVVAQQCLDARKAQKEIELYDKLFQAGRFHASFKVIGTLSTRMAGSDGLNPQGIKHDEYVRRQFPLAFEPLQLGGGDFAGFEVSIADAVYNDKELRKQLCTCGFCEYICTLEEYSQSDDCPKCGAKDSRLKIHALFAMALNPGMTYEQIVATKGMADDLYDKGKKGVFAEFYGGNWSTLVTRGLCKTEEDAKAGEERFMRRFRGAGDFRKKINDQFCSMRQPKGIGTKVEWHEPADYIETVLGFRRYFTLENMICRSLFELANKPPQQWKAIKIKCVRRDREQTLGGAVMSALYAAAFAVQSANLRAAANHVIQSTGASITKELQCRLWTLQPSGVNDWIVQPMNIHDEVMIPALEKVKSEIRQIVDQLVVDMRPVVPLIKIDWSDNMKTWAEK